jgi:hypothetical protein
MDWKHNHIISFVPGPSRMLSTAAFVSAGSTPVFGIASLPSSTIVPAWKSTLKKKEEYNWIALGDY